MKRNSAANYNYLPCVVDLISFTEKTSFSFMLNDNVFATFPFCFPTKTSHILKQVKISRKTLFSASEIPKSFTLCNYFLFQWLSRTICLAFSEKIIFDNMRPRMTFWTFITSFDWTDRASLIVARARSLPFASYIAYSLGLIIARGRCVSG